MTNQLRPIDVPDDVIEHIANVSGMDSARAVDFVCYMYGRMRPVVWDLETERFFEWMKQMQR
jgi:hypothetical protein